MIIELLGVSGSGKSTLIAPLISALGTNKIVAIESSQALLGWSFRFLHRQPRLQNIMVELFLLPEIFAVLLSQSAALRSISKLLRQQRLSSYHRIRLYRSAVRKLALHRRLTKLDATSPNCYWIVDEGITSIPQVVLGNSAKELEITQAIELCKLLPKPAIVLHLAPDLEVLMQRGLRRPDPVINFRDSKELRAFLQRSQAICQVVARELAPHCQVLQFTEIKSDQGDLAAKISKLLLDRDNPGIIAV